MLYKTYYAVMHTLVGKTCFKCSINAQMAFLCFTRVPRWSEDNPIDVTGSSLVITFAVYHDLSSFH